MPRRCTTTGLLSAGKYTLKDPNKTTRNTFEKSSKLTMRTTERCPWRHPEVFIDNFAYFSHHALVFLLLALGIYLFAGYNITPHNHKGFQSGNSFVSNFPRWNTQLFLFEKNFGANSLVNLPGSGVEWV